MVHHTGSPNAHQDTTTNYCGSGYDFHIRWGGHIVVCARWADDHGSHASGCNCKTEGIMLNGCFGGCDYGNVSGPSDDQECSLAYLMAHLDTPLYTEARFRPHRNCASWNPCSDPSPRTTVCCGTNLTKASTADYNWDANGQAFRNRIWSKASNWLQYGCCARIC